MKTNPLPQNEYNSKERILLWILALISFFGLNTAFVYGMFFERKAILGALNNPIAFTFICEAFLLMGALGYLLSKWRVSKLGLGWVVLLSFVGSMGFALPIILHWQTRKKPKKSEGFF